MQMVQMVQMQVHCKEAGAWPMLADVHHPLALCSLNNGEAKTALALCVLRRYCGP
jgi:hypothetical protein